LRLSFFYDTIKIVGEGMKKRNGFTMVELLSVIIILGVITTLAIAGISGVLKKTKRSYLDSQNRMVVLSAKTYYSDHRSKLPKVIGPVHEVKLQTLIDLKYIDPVKDAEGEDCVISTEGKESMVYVQKVSKEEYKYRGYLYCSGEESGVYDKTPPTVSLTPSKTITTSKRPLTVTLKAEDENGVLSYRYIIYKDGKEYKDTGYKNYKKKQEIVLKETGKYMIKAYAYDTAGNRGSTEGGIYDIKIEKPDCTNLKITADHPELTAENRGWTKENIKMTIENKTDTIESWSLQDVLKNESTVKSKTLIKKSTSKNKNTTIKEEGKHSLTIIAYNAEGETCTKKVTYGINKTPPSLNVVLTKNENRESYLPDTWYAGNVLTEAKSTSKNGVSYRIMYSLNGASYKEEQTGSSHNENLSCLVTEEGSSNIKYKVEDEAGNIKESPKYTIKLDRTPPTMPIISGNPNHWVNYDFSLSVRTEEKDSGVNNWQYSYDLNTWTSYPNSATSSFKTTPFSKERNQLVYLRATDKAGNISPVNSTLIQLDKTAPKCVSSGGKTSTLPVQIYGTCDPLGGSPCTGNAMKIYTGVGTYRNQSPGTVSDQAGNTVMCPADQTIVIKSPVPTVTIAGNIKKWQCGKCRDSCDDWAAKVNGTCPDGVKGNSIGKVTYTADENKVTFKWKVVQGKETHIDTGNYVDFIIKDSEGDIFIKKRIKETSSSWGRNSSHSGKITVTFKEKGTYKILINGNSSNPSFDMNFGTIKVT